MGIRVTSPIAPASAYGCPVSTKTTVTGLRFLRSQTAGISHSTYLSQYMKTSKSHTTVHGGVMTMDAAFG
jgi:hypothetical protein